MIASFGGISISWRRAAVCAASSLVLVCAAPCHASNANWGFGVSAGVARARFHGQDFRADAAGIVRRTEDQQPAAGITAARRLDDRWSLELSYTSFRSYADTWTSATSARFRDVYYRFDYRASALAVGARFALPVARNFELALRLGAAANRASNRFTIDSSRHIEPPLLPCPTPGVACYPPFSTSPTFARAGQTTTTRVSPTLGLSAGLRLTPTSTLALRYDEHGRFGRAGPVGRVSVAGWSVFVEQSF